MIKMPRQFCITNRKANYPGKKGSEQNQEIEYLNTNTNHLQISK